MHTPDLHMLSEEEGEEMLEGVAGVQAAYGQLWGRGPAAHCCKIVYRQLHLTVHAHRGRG